MRKIFIPIVALLLVTISESLLGADNEIAIGSEYILPLKYPKASITGDFVFNQEFLGFADPALRSRGNLTNKFGVGAAFETGLYKYLNAGGGISASIPHARNEPFHMRAMIFAKPLIPIGERVSVYARIGGGLAWASKGSLLFELKQDESFSESYDRVYKDQEYHEEHFGGVGVATVGAEWFFLSRLGIAVEFGIRTSIFRHTINWWFVDEKPRVPGTPSGINYMVYEFPLSVTILGII